VYYSIDVGQLVHRLQVERDTSVLYLSALGPETRTFLLSEYINTDRTIDRLSYWPGDLDKANGAMFLSKSNFQGYLAGHRQILSPDRFSIQDEIDFYSRIIDTTIYWLYNTITESKFSHVVHSCLVLPVDDGLTDQHLCCSTQRNVAMLQK
jgi:hypothetical protein